jgi:uncharacterized zinc-type alcohol dehydrogenase-like protein
MTLIKAYAAKSPTSGVSPFSFDRNGPNEDEVRIEIMYCGVCHTDIHIVKNEWQGTIYPVVPGHEIVGKVVEVGSKVKKFKEGDLAAVGCMINSCRHCYNCQAHLEQYCLPPGPMLTYNSPDPEYGRATYGGYSTSINVTQDFVLTLSKKFDPARLAGVAPLLCAGITTYSPLRHWGVTRGQKVGVVGLGGLGHMGIKFAHSFGAHVVCFTTSPSKIADAKRLGADEVVISTSPDAFHPLEGSFDFILDTVAASHSLDPYLASLKRDGTLCLVGAPASPHPSPTVTLLIFQRRKLAGSLIGGIKETQEMLDYCAANQIYSDIEMIPIQKINEAYERMLKSDVKYRFVIDNTSLTQA